LTGSAANFSGRGAFDLDLAGKGRTIIANVGTAAGTVGFKIADGAIKGFNLASTLCAAYNAKERLPVPQGQPKETAYQSIAGTATVAAGKAKSEDLLARTAFMDIYGGGTLALVEQQLDYALDAKLTGKIGIPGCESLDGFVGDRLPFKIKGTVTDPSITPDFSKLVQRKLREEVQDRLKDKLRDILR
jgi:AsmA protein